MLNGWTVEQIYDATSIDPWFLRNIEQIVKLEQELGSASADGARSTGSRPVLENGLPGCFFRGFDPQGPVKLPTQPPHWEQAGAAYFITFRLDDSFPQPCSPNGKTSATHGLPQHPQPWDAKTTAEYEVKFTEKMRPLTTKAMASVFCKQRRRWRSLPKPCGTSMGIAIRLDDSS